MQVTTSDLAPAPDRRLDAQHRARRPHLLEAQGTRMPPGIRCARSDPGTDLEVREDDVGDE
jgi:hypothetical protein